MRALAQESGAVVVGVAYARAPEHPYPAALNQVVAVVEWLAERGRAIGIDPARIGIAGVSAGANLALAACLRLRDRGQRLVTAAALYVGLFGADLDTPSYDAFDETDYGPSRRRVRTLFNLYAPGAAALHDPYVVPLTADLAGLPDLYLAAAGVDTLRDDSTRLAARVREAGGRATIQVLDGVTHGFTLYQAMVGKARQAIAAGGAFLTDRLERP